MNGMMALKNSPNFSSNLNNMRIARIIEYFPPHIGGMEQHGLTLSFEQIKLGYDVEVFIGYGGDWENPKKWGGLVLGKNIHRMPFQFLPLYSKIRRFLFNFWAYNKIKKIHKKNPYDIVHLHGDFMESCFGGKLSKKLKIPAIITIHAGLNKRLLQPKNAAYFRNVAKIICVSNEIANDLESIGILGNKLAVISSGVYLIEFQNVNNSNVAAIKERYSKPIIISVGVLRINKGFKYLIEAFRLVKEKFNTATLLIIGDGSDKEKLKTQAKNIGNIHFLGRQNHGKVIEYLKAADIFVLASVYMEGDREGTPTSIMEAMAAGLPIIAANVGGIADLVENGKNGFVVNPGSSKDLAEVIIRLISNPYLAKKISVKNLEDIKPKNWRVITEKINEVYKSILY